METLVFRFERPISNNKENKMFFPSPPWTPLAKKIFFLISLMYMEILVFKFEGLISNNKENGNLAKSKYILLEKGVL